MLILSNDSRKMESRGVTRSDLFKRIILVVEQKRNWKGAQTGTITLKPYLVVTTEYALPPAIPLLCTYPTENKYIPFTKQHEQEC